MSDAPRMTAGCECGHPDPCPFIEGCKKVVRDDEGAMADASQLTARNVLRRADDALGMPVTWAGLLVAICAVCTVRAAWGIARMLLS